MGMPVALLDGQGRLISANAAARAVFGLADDDPSPVRFPALGLVTALPDDLDLFQQLVSGAHDKCRIRADLAGPDGTHKSCALELLRMPSLDSGGAYAIVTVHDEETAGGEGPLALPGRPVDTLPETTSGPDLEDGPARASNAESCRAALDAIHVPLFLLDTEGRVLSCSRAALALTGMSAGEVVNRPHDDVLAFLHTGVGTCPFLQMKRSRARSTTEVDFGERRYQVSASPLADAEGRLTGCVLAMVDVTAMRRAEEALKDNLRFQEAVFQTVPSLTVIADSDGRIAMLNYAATELTRYDLEDVIGKRFAEVLTSEASWQRLAATARVQEAGPDLSFLDVTIRTKTGEECVIECCARLLQRRDMTYYLVSGIDVTRRRRLESQLTQTEKLSALGELIAGVAHELNNPLAAVIGYAQLLAQQQVPPDVQSDVVAIEKNAVRCKGIVDNLLRFARQRQPERKPISVHEVLDDTVELVQHQFRMANIEILREYSESSLVVEADANQLEQVFVNILTNARQAIGDAAGDGRLVIRTSAASGVVRVEFRDNGPGIEPDKLGSIFDPFFTTKPAGEGTGLGLSVCFGIVAAHGGQTWAESQVGEGTSFFIELPAGKDRVVSRRPAGTATQAIKLRNRVLVVDDEQPVLEVLDRLLTQLGYNVTATGSGEEALAALAERGYDIILSDYRMPGFDGRALHEAVTARYPDLRRRIVFCTGDTVAGDTADFLKATGCRVVSKPFDMGELARALGELQEEIINDSQGADDAGRLM